MRQFMLLVTFMMVLLSINGEGGEDTYPTTYDHIDVDEILASKRLLKVYVNCILGNGKCSDDGKFVRDHFEDIILTECARCNPKQKGNVRKILTHFILHEPEYTKQFREKYDPNGVYWKKIQENAAKEGLKVPD